MGSFRNNRGVSGFGSEGRSRGSKFSGGSRGGFGGGRGGGFRGRDGGSGGFRGGDREMHDATCDKCKKPCQVPFRPSGGKPIYCSNCFRSEGNSDSREYSRPSFAPRGQDRASVASGGVSQEQFNQLNKKLDAILAILEQLEIEVVDDSDEDDDAETDEEEDKSEENEEDEDSKHKPVKK